MSSRTLDRSLQKSNFHVVAVSHPLRAGLLLLLLLFPLTVNISFWNKTLHMQIV